jgi:hypothetical protein
MTWEENSIDDEVQMVTVQSAMSLASDMASIGRFFHSVYDAGWHQLPRADTAEAPWLLPLRKLSVRISDRQDW